ncbi:AAA family ATPase [Nitrospira moscoviensis]|uniref:Shikimate kinase n=1 Tax=Nitrospira moscoviensis TaxID=42253 RepID=A0A0K2GFU0_NITMO|nr:AAA family ATPase [Nitrospira moscoviensis]ALA59830.1 Shikimate kinase [Nitrospira moscoviensis]
MKSDGYRGIGLCGAHRVGKTTLAQAVSQAAGIPFLKTHTSLLFTQKGLDPAQPMPFTTRLSIQREILAAAVAVWSRAAGRFISDRTPLDMAAYTLADVQGTTPGSDALLQYLEECVLHTNRFFSTLVVIPPGIPLVREPGKAALHEAYIEHVHTLVVGLCHDPRILAGVHLVPREVLSLNARVQRTLSLITQPDG